MSRLAGLLILGLFPAAIAAEPAPFDELDFEGPWTVLPADADVDALMAPLTYDDILAMADLDGDPSVITDEEARMIEVLGQVLLVTPLPLE